MLSDEHWWDERLSAWSHEGFDTENIRTSLEENPERASDLLMDFENLVKINRGLRRRIIESSLSQEKKSGWLDRLDDFSKTEEILLDWDKEASENRPWESYVSRAEDKWVDLGIRIELTNIVKRLENLDPSSYPACQPLYILFDDVSSKDLISDMLDDIEKDEQKRREIISEMIALLESEGVDASAARGMTISDGLEYLNSMQDVAREMRNTRLKIDKEIRPFDEELANQLISKRNEGLDDEVSAIVQNLGARLTGLNETIKNWEDSGISILKGSKISADDLLEWEANLPELEKMVNLHLQAIERWDHFRKVWPDKVEPVEFIGQLDKTEEFLDLVDSLDAQWREYELEGMSMISRWEDLGFVMDLWRNRVSDEPKSAVAWLKIEEENYLLASKLINALMRLDASISGEEEILRRAAILREFELETSLLEEMSDFIEKQARRASRHRSMLEIEWFDMVRTGKAVDRPTGNLSLFEFENLIADSRMGKSGLDVPINRLEDNLRDEIERWHRLGFDVNSLRDDLASSPMEVALKISSIRELVAKHEQLRKRVEHLDWRRDPELAVAINLELSRPDRLASLETNIPKIAVELARKDVVDEHFKFFPWKPNRRSRKVLIPVPQNTVEDAMEAILEEMETEEIKMPQEQEFEVLEPVIAKKPIEQKPVKQTPVEPKAAEIVKPQKREIIPTAPPSAPAQDVSLDSITRLLRALGLEKEAELFSESKDINAVRRSIASHVGKEPRDMRLDRLLRLSLRLMPNGDNDDSKLELIDKLAELAQTLAKWTRIRLEARHSGASGYLVKDADELGVALSRIPGPGTPLPLDADEYDLPDNSDIEGLGNEVSVLSKRVSLSTSGGVR